MEVTTRARARMRLRTTGFGVLAAFCSLSALDPLAVARADPGASYFGDHFELVALALPAGLSAGNASVVNNDGLIVGLAWADNGSPQGVVWRDRVPVVIPDSLPVTVNDAGQVAGNQFPSDAPSRGFLWANGQLTTLAPTSPGPGRFSTVSALAPDGTAIGVSGSDLAGSEIPGPNTRATVWYGGVATDLGTLGGTWSSADLINDRGQVAGVSATATGDQHAFLSAPGGLRDLGTLGGRYSYPIAINNRGQVVGMSDTPDGHGHAVLWEDGQIIDLGVAPGFGDSAAIGLNDRGQVLVENYGTAGTGVDSQAPAFPASTPSAYVWTAGQRQYLTGFGGDTISPLEINEDGAVIGSATTPDGVARPYLWSDGVARDIGGPGTLASGVVSSRNRLGQLVGFTTPQSGRQVPLFWQAD
ncbi:hypothetical protein [Frankia sp. R43]|uniref:hypothetical protein n=1 Tax=Frankia sp. R43 TaxID=269536 RepID=UPI00128FAF50|nr:hypothetical protein [Frankia sp. R43]